MMTRRSGFGLFLATIALVACGRTHRGRDPGPLPELRYDNQPGQGRVARIDVAQVAEWCDAEALPLPPAVGSAEPVVAEALYGALAAAARQRSAESFGQVGRIAESLDAHRSAIEYFRLAGDKDGGDYRWPYYRGSAHQALGENQQAIEALELARTIDASYPTTFARLGQLYLDEGRYEEAHDSFRRYMEMKPEDWFGQVGLGRLALLDGDLDQARELLEQAARIRAADFQVQFQLGRLHAALGDRERAQAHFDAAAALPKGAWFLLRDPLMQELEESAGSAASLQREFERLSETRDWPTLTRLAEEIVDRRPNDATMLLNLAGIYRIQSRFEDAHATLDRALKVRPDDSRFLCARAETFLAQGEFERSLTAAQSALDIQPEMVRGLVVRGRARLMLKRYAKAELDLRQVAEQVPEDAANLFALGEALRLQGKTSEAIAAYGRVLELQPGFPNAQKMLAYLQGTG